MTTAQIDSYNIFTNELLHVLELPVNLNKFCFQRRDLKPADCIIINRKKRKIRQKRCIGEFFLEFYSVLEMCNQLQSFDGIYSTAVRNIIIRVVTEDDDLTTKIFVSKEDHLLYLNYPKHQRLLNQIHITFIYLGSNNDLVFILSTLNDIDEFVDDFYNHCELIAEYLFEF